MAIVMFMSSKNIQRKKKRKTSCWCNVRDTKELTQQKELYHIKHKQQTFSRKSSFGVIMFLGH
jgi:hypothetical protein